MKATQRDFATLAARAAREARVFFFCGPDESGVADAADKIVALLADPGECIELAGADLRKDPVRLGDEARSTSLFGGARHIRVRAQGDEAHDAVQTLISADVETCPVVIVATGATDKSRTAKLLADRPDALVAMFWPPDLAAVTSAVRGMANGAGLRLGADLAERIARSAGLDTRIARSEVTKLALYRDASPEAPQTLTAADLDAVTAATEDDGFAPLVDAILGGHRRDVGPELKRMRESGMNAVGLLLAFERRAAQLAGLSSRLAPGANLATFLRGEAAARRIVWKDQGALSEQLRIWHGSRLERLVRHLIALHQKMMSTSADSELLMAEGLVLIAQLACAVTKHPTKETA